MHLALIGSCGVTLNATRKCSLMQKMIAPLPGAQTMMAHQHPPLRKRVDAGLADPIHVHSRADLIRHPHHLDGVVQDQAISGPSLQTAPVSGCPCSVFSSTGQPSRAMHNLCCGRAHVRLWVPLIAHSVPAVLQTVDCRERGSRTPCLSIVVVWALIGRQEGC